MPTTIYKDRVRETCTFAGTSDVTLSGAPLEFVDFNNGDTDYLITNVAETLWEVGQGTVTAGTLVRNTVQSNSSGTLVKIDFGFVGGIALQPVTATKLNDLNQSMVWRGVWDFNVNLYNTNDVVRDGSWTMICTEAAGCSDRPAPQPVGAEHNLYTGTISDATPVSAKQIIFGNRYNIVIGEYVNGYRVYTYPGQHYEITSVKNPLTAPIFEQIASFDSPATQGWVNINIDTLLLAAGAEFDLVAVVNEPPVSPTTWNGNWNYSLPNNITVPIAGEANQSAKEVAILNFNVIDDDGNDEAARPAGLKLADIVIGDLIDGAGISWVVQNVQDNGTYFSFTVSPGTQGFPTGLTNFVFSVAIATPINYAEDIDFNISNANISGLLAVDDSYSNIVPDNNQYGIDLLVQDANISTEWEVVATSEGTGGGSSAPSGNIVYADATNNLEVGYTTDVEPDSFTTPLVPDLALPYLKLLVVTSSFELNAPVSNGSCEYYVTSDGLGTYTMTVSGVTIIGTAPDIEPGSTYVLNVRKFGAVTVAQLVLVA